MNPFPETSPVLVLHVTVAVSVIPVITQDMVVVDPCFTSLLTDWTSAKETVNGCYGDIFSGQRVSSLRLASAESSTNSSCHIEMSAS